MCERVPSAFMAIECIIDQLGARWAALAVPGQRVELEFVGSSKQSRDPHTPRIPSAVRCGHGMWHGLEAQ